MDISFIWYVSYGIGKLFLSNNVELIPKYLFPSLKDEMIVLLILLNIFLTTDYSENKTISFL